MTHQQTLTREYEFVGKGLHTGKVATMVVKPAPIDFGIRFIRTDIGPDAMVRAIASNVTNTARSTTIAYREITVVTVEHILSALTGMGVDNACIEINNIEVPILDGSARPYIDAMWADGFVQQDAPRHYVELKEPIEIRNEETGAFVKIEPAEDFSYDLTIDFNSKVMGIQSAHWDKTMDYTEEIGICRTFVFFHEIEFLLKNNLVKGGDVDNAIVVVEHPVTPEQIEHMASLFNQPRLSIRKGYLSNINLHYSNECSRHKLLDIIGDLRLCGGFLKAKVTAFKAGHSINTKAAKKVLEQLGKN